jgi:hypothetical protein
MDKKWESCLDFSFHNAISTNLPDVALPTFEKSSVFISRLFLIAPIMTSPS